MDCSPYSCNRVSANEESFATELTKEDGYSF